MSRLVRLITVLVIAAAGCRSILGGGDDKVGLEQLNESRATWDAANISTYVFVVRNTCFCVLAGDGVQVTVVNGAITSLTLVETGDAVPAEYASAYRTLDALFDLILDAIDRNVAFLQVQYDTLYGFPLSAYIDYKTSVADDEFGWQVMSFTPGT